MTADAVPILDEIASLIQKLREARRIVVCAPGREEYVQGLLFTGGIAEFVTVQSSPFVEGNDVFVVNQLALSL